MKKKYLLFLALHFLLACSNDNGTVELPIVENEPEDPEITSPPIILPDGSTPCVNGFASIFPCKDIDLLGIVTLEEMQASSANDIWGWTDPNNSKEYALVGLDNGIAFVDISNDEELVYLGKLPTATTSSGWRDVKVFENHAFVVSEAAAHGMQVFDLTQLAQVSEPPVVFNATSRFTGFGNAHNIAINEETGYAYVVGTNRNDIYSGGAHFIDINDPANPVSAGGYGESGYTHDAHVITYIGPDMDYVGRELLVGANENMIGIVDVTNKDDPQLITSFDYGNIGYTHQGWFTEDQRYFILGDELDEVDFGFNSRTLIFDFSDLDNPLLHSTYFGPTPAIDHNGYVSENEFYLANYTAGIRVIDISGIESGPLEEKAFFDTFPNNNNATFDGVWSSFTSFESGKIIASDINLGLFVLVKTN